MSVVTFGYSRLSRHVVRHRSKKCLQTSIVIEDGPCNGDLFDKERTVVFVEFTVLRLNTIRGEGKG